jgi:hypothetical protein
MKTVFKFYYQKYKKQLLPVVLFSLCFFIIFRVIIPQLSSISESNQIISDRSKELETLTQTLEILSSLNQDQASSNLSTATSALPTKKDIAVIFSALSSAASASETELREFSLKVGGLYGRAERGSGVKGVPLIDVVARITSAEASGYVNFTTELQERLPLSEVKSVDVNENAGTYELGFYYKPLDLTLVAKQDKVVPLTQKDLNLMSQLETWKNQ